MIVNSLKGVEAECLRDLDFVLLDKPEATEKLF